MVGVERSAGDKADSGKVDNVQFTEKSFGSRPIDYIAII